MNDVVQSLRTAWLGRSLRHLAVCGSTNDEAAAWARDTEVPAPHGAVVIADAQTGGRGRLGRTWHSPAGENLYLSTVLRPPLPPAAVPPLTLCAGVAVAQALEECGARPELKWPNDVLLDGKKTAGILTEMSTMGGRVAHVVVGIGVNVATTRFPDELAGRATSLALALGRPIDRGEVAAALCGCLELWYERLLAEGPAPILDAWKRRATLLGRHVEVSSGNDRITGVAEDLDPDGALRLRADDGRILRVIAGEITG